MISLKLKTKKNLLLLGYGLSLILSGCNTSSADTDTQTKQLNAPSQSIEKPSDAQSKEQSMYADNHRMPPEHLAHTVKKVAPEESSPTIPKVYLSPYHQQFCKLRVGDSFPEVKLPNFRGKSTEITSILGKQATVILAWKPDKWMAQMALADIQREIAKKHAPENVSVLGILIGGKNSKAQSLIKQSNAEFTQFVDREGKAFAMLGSEVLPRVYVLDPDGKITWFDIEYSESTHRELLQCIDLLTGK